MGSEIVEIDNTNFKLVLTGDNAPIIDGNNICLQRIEDEVCILVPFTQEIAEMFQLKQIFNANFTSPTTQQQKHWNRNETLMLINLFQQFEGKFLSTTTKNDKVWAEISSEMKKHSFFYTATQCKDKFKYLKMRYLKKKDNMKDSSSGAACFKFEFFNEMDDIFGNKPNVEPVAIASSSRDNKILNTSGNDVLEESDGDTVNTPPVKKRKTDKSNESFSLNELVQDIKRNAAKREEARDRRHTEQIAARDRATNAFIEKMDELVKKI